MMCLDCCSKHQKHELGITSACIACIEYVCVVWIQWDTKDVIVCCVHLVMRRWLLYDIVTSVYMFLIYQTTCRPVHCACSSIEPHAMFDKMHTVDETNACQALNKPSGPTNLWPPNGFHIPHRNQGHKVWGRTVRPQLVWLTFWGWKWLHFWVRVWATHFSTWFRAVVSCKSARRW